MLSHSSTNRPSERVAVILAGCGAKDGSEITEAVSLLISLSKANFQFECFAPDRKTHHVIDHLTGQEVGYESRNQLHEAARIARGRVRSLDELKQAHFAAVVLAGGFGVVKNLCNFAFAGEEAVINADVKHALLPFVLEKKPLAALCIAPVVLALLCREAHIKGAQLTLGDGSAHDAIRALQNWGSQHKATRPGEACVDSVNKLVSAPAYMFDDATPADIFASAEALVLGLRSLLETPSRGK